MQYLIFRVLEIYFFPVLQVTNEKFFTDEKFIFLSQNIRMNKTIRQKKCWRCNYFLCGCFFYFNVFSWLISKRNSSAKRLKSFVIYKVIISAKDTDCEDMMVLALISTACISNVIYSLQAMLIYARISNAIDAEDITLFKRFCTCSFCLDVKLHLCIRCTGQIIRNYPKKVCFITNMHAI